MTFRGLKMKCRFCGTILEHVFVDLVNAPLSNAYLTEEQLNEPEVYFPLKIFVCHECWLVQVDAYKKSDDIFDKDYAYFSSMSSSWLKHSKAFVDSIVLRLSLGSSSQVAEIASNDGYLLQYFKDKHIPCFGIEPTKSTATASREKGIETLESFFSLDLARELVRKEKSADLIIGNNVLAHVPDIVDFVSGMAFLLKSRGTITMEFPHLLNLLKFSQFDTIYHEHFSYLSLSTTISVFHHCGLKIYDVQELDTHGGSLRIYATHAENKAIDIHDRVGQVLVKEDDFGLNDISTHKSLQNNADKIKSDFLSFLLNQKRKGMKVAGYGAAAKGNTLLNYCGVKNDLIEFVADAAPSKQGKFLPGSHVPVVEESKLSEFKPDFIILFPWNIKNELVQHLTYTRAWGAKFVTAVPGLEIF